MLTTLNSFPPQSLRRGYQTVFHTLHGSRLYGMNTTESDYDYLGACVESKEEVIGLGKFEQHIWKTDNAEGTVYSLRKYIHLLIEGNPTLLSTAFSPVAYDEIGITSPEFHSLFVSKAAGPKFYGYMTAQIKRIHTNKGLHITRKHLIEAYGWDVKYGAHVVRLGHQAVEYLNNGTITLPIPNRELSHVMDVRNGQYTFAEFKLMADNLLADVDEAQKNSPLPPKPQYDKISTYLADVYIAKWDYL